MKKTINVQNLKNEINDMLRYSTCTPDTRFGMITVLEQVLHQSGNYSGFQYLSSDRLADEFLPGIRENNDFTNTDSSRRRYF